MTKEQLLAANPTISAWVVANAGTGKTKILVDRVLRLLLLGVEPKNILCLTFTKAAAAEMLERIYAILATWARSDEAAIRHALEQLTTHIPKPEQIHKARNLFLEVIDAPVGLQIKTLHAFCQSLIAAFPIESGVPAYCQLADDRSLAQLMREAQIALYIENDQQAHINEAMALCAQISSENKLSTICRQILYQRHQWLDSKEKMGSIEAMIAALYATLEVTPSDTMEQLIEQYSHQENRALRVIADSMAQYGTVTDKKHAAIIHNWYAKTPDERSQYLASYQGLYLKKDGDPKQVPRLITKKMKDMHPEAEYLLFAEQERAIRFKQQYNAIYIAKASEAIITLAYHIITLYTQLKDTAGYIDYDDLIYRVVKLLSASQDVSWILYKLDSNIDHILIDEAQDTSKEQWHIIRAITQEFFVGDMGKEQERTLFVVGDDKQSIYGFQGADPESFGVMQRHFAQLANQANKPWHDISLKQSFRSVPAILDYVDVLFSDPEMQPRVSSTDQPIEHIAYRAQDAGTVELWPLVETESTDDEANGWDIPKEYKLQHDAQTMLSQNIATTIKGWLDNERILPNKKRPVAPGDIMILVRKRGTLMKRIVQALKRQHIPVAGVDRLELKGQLVIEDLLSLAHFLLLPSNDLALAEILKSPLIGITEEELYILAVDRGSHTLWHSLREHAVHNPTFQQVENWLQLLLKKVDNTTPYQLYSHVIDVLQTRTAFYARLGEEVADALDEFLTLILTYESLHIPSLQGFIQWIEESDTEIKRDMEQIEGKVRIMTVHGSKGLQAPIIVLPDTTNAPTILAPPIIMNEQELPIYTASKEKRNDMLEQHIKQRQQEEINESMRLLYVAMTRAEDELYITGIKPARKLDPYAWYSILQEKMQKIGMQFEDKWVYYSQWPEAIIAQPTKDMRQDAPPPLPDYMREPVTQQAITETHSVTQSDIASSMHIYSPQHQQLSDADRGTLIHYLLQTLVTIPISQREQAAKQLYHAMRMPYDCTEYNMLVQQVMDVMNNPDLADIFAGNAQSEVPICGKINGKTYVGRVDRLIMSEKKVIIVDYKTSKQVPDHPKDISSTIKTQMQHYASIMQSLYPEKHVVTAIIWTHTGTYMELV